MRQFNPSRYPLVYINAKLGKLAINQEPRYGMEVSNIIASTRNKYKCDVCSLRFQTYIELKYHTVTHEDGDANLIQELEPMNAEQFPSTVTALSGSSVQSLECDVCGATFDNNARFEAHVVLHKKFSCTNCSARFSTSSELVTHGMDIHNILYEGIIQQKPVKDTTEPESLKERSTLNHSEIEVLKYRCKVCSRRFVDCFQLQRHKRMHSKDAKVTDDKQVSKIGCDLCNLEFSFKEDMIEHRKTHLKPLITADEDDDDIVIVGTFRANAPASSVINLDSSDSENELIFNTVPTDKPERATAVTSPHSKGSTVSTTATTKINTQQSVQRNEHIAQTKENTASILRQNVKPISNDPSKTINDKAKYGVTIRCMVCNFITTSENVMQEHHKVHTMPNVVVGTPSSKVGEIVTLSTAAINQNPNQVTNVVTNTSENCTTDIRNTITTTTITTPSSIDASPSSSWGNQLVFISPSTAGSQIIQHPIFIIPGNNSSNNTSNVDINIRTTNQSNTTPKPEPKKRVSVLAKPPPRQILPALIPVQTSIPAQETSTRNIISAPHLNDLITSIDTSVDPPISKYSIQIVNDGEGYVLQKSGAYEKVVPRNTVIQENRYVLVKDPPEDTEMQQNAGTTSTDSTDYDNVHEFSTTTQSILTQSDSTVQVVGQRPKISVKPLSLLMKSPLKNYAAETQPVSTPEPTIFKTPLDQATTSVQKDESETTRPANLPKLTAISKAQLIDILSKKPMTVINKADFPTINLPLQSLSTSQITEMVSGIFTPSTETVPLVQVPTAKTSTTASTKTTPKRAKVIAKRPTTAPVEPEPSKPEPSVLEPESSAKEVEPANTNKDSTPTVERGMHKCGSCSYEAKKRGKLHMHCKFKCKMCRFISCKLNNLDTHYESSHNIRHICCPCDMVFADNDALLKHKNEVHICSTCNKCQIDLTKHNNGFKCPLCEYSTCKQNALNSHYKATHNIVRNCAPCNIAFGSIADFEDHKYSMHFCSKCRTYKMNLNVHQTFCRGDGDKILDRVESQRNLEVIELD